MVKTVKISQEELENLSRKRTRALTPQEKAEWEAYKKRDISYLQTDEQYQKELEPVRTAKTNEEKQVILNELSGYYLERCVDSNFRDKYSRDRLQDLYNHQGLRYHPITMRAYSLPKGYEKTLAI